MEANITIKIGCEAGSKFCGDCKLIRHILDGSQLQKHACEVFTRKTRTGSFRSQELEREGDFFENTIRCQQCLDAEKPASEQVDKHKIKNIIMAFDPEEFNNKSNINELLWSYNAINERLEELLKEEG